MKSGAGRVASGNHSQPAFLSGSRLTGSPCAGDPHERRHVALADDRKIVDLRRECDRACRRVRFLGGSATGRRVVHVVSLRLPTRKLPAAVAVDADAAAEKQTAVVDDDGRNPACGDERVQWATVSFGSTEKTRNRSGAIGEKLDMWRLSMLSKPSAKCALFFSTAIDAHVVFRVADRAHRSRRADLLDLALSILRRLRRSLVLRWRFAVGDEPAFPMMSCTWTN